MGCVSNGNTYTGNKDNQLIAEEHQLLLKLRGYLTFFSARLPFILPNEHQKQYFYEWQSKPRVKMSLLVLMSEIIH